LRPAAPSTSPAGRRTPCTPYFLLAGDPKVPIIYEVDRIRDGKSFTTRRGRRDPARRGDIHHGGVVPPATSPGWVTRRPMPDVPAPEQLPDEAHIKARVLPLMPIAVRRYYERERPIEWRPVELDRYLGKKIENGRFMSGFARPAGFPMNRLSINACSPTPPTCCCSTPPLIPHGRTGVREDPHGREPRSRAVVSPPVSCDDWLLYAHDSPIFRLPRLFPRPDLRPRWHAGRLRLRRRACCASGRRDDTGQRPGRPNRAE
jgi:acyl-CoA thioesterase-2